MKRLSYIFVLVLGSLLLALPSCNFLDLHDPDAMEPNKFYQNKSDMEGLLASAYAAIRPAYDKLFFVTEMKSDNATTFDTGTAGGLYSTFVSHTVTSSNSIVGDIYSAFYICIHRCNLVIEHIDGVDMPDADKDRIRGEALFLRALSHFYLTRLWGPVTIMSHTVSNSKEALNKSRSPQSDVYAFIISDLKRIADTDVLPATCRGDQFGHASKTAACALLGRVYLHDPQIFKGKLHKSFSTNGIYTTVLQLDKDGNTEKTIVEKGRFPMIFGDQMIYFGVFPDGEPHPRDPDNPDKGTTVTNGDVYSVSLDTGETKLLCHIEEAEPYFWGLSGGNTLTCGDWAAINTPSNYPAGTDKIGTYSDMILVNIKTGEYHISRFIE